MNPVTNYEQPGAIAMPMGGAMAAEVQRAVAEVQAAVMLARMNPREVNAARARIADVCTRPSLASRALYQYSRGGTDIAGPSIRLAEAIAQEWGNFHFGTKEVSSDGKTTEVECFAWDVEKGTRSSRTIRVPHSRYTKSGGNQSLVDPRDIYERVANDAARRLRACILACIPGDVVDDAVAQVKATLAKQEQVTPERLAALADAFAEFGVTVPMIEKRIQRKLDAITPQLIVMLRAVYTALTDGITTAAQEFDMTTDKAAGDAQAPAAAATRAEQVKQRVRQQRATAKPKETPPPEPEPAPTPPAEDPAFTYAELADAIMNAPDADKLAEAEDLIGQIADEKQRDELALLAQGRREELGQ